MGDLSPTRVSGLFPGLATAVYETVELGSIDELLSPERDSIAGAAPIRIGQFAASRICARAAMAHLGLDTGPVLRGDDRRPLWPDGVAGSITHTEGLIMAAVAREEDLGLCRVGIDAEQRDRVSPDLFDKLFTAEEISRLNACTESDRDLLATVGFSAKEAVYKAQHPLTRSWVGFTDVRVDVTIAAAGLSALAYPVTDLGVLDQLRWPLVIGVDDRTTHVVTTAVAHPSGRPLRSEAR